MQELGDAGVSTVKKKGNKRGKNVSVLLNSGVLLLNWTEIAIYFIITWVVILGHISLCGGDTISVECQVLDGAEKALQILKNK